jgi:glycosyltransferase involved in cell wall biosynthesis
MKVLHLITGLEVGGAEMMLLNLLKQPNFAKETSRVISLTGIGTIGSRIQKLGTEVVALGMEPGHPKVEGLFRLIQILRRDPPDLIQSWMYHADFLGSLAAFYCGNIPIVWGLHHTLDGDHPVQKRTMRILQLNALLSKWLPRRVVCCAESARLAHMQAGYFTPKMIVIPNGIDINEFSPDPPARSEVRRELGLDTQTPLIGLFARFHPQKDHKTFTSAAGILHETLPGVHFLLAGAGVIPENHELVNWLQAAGILDQTHLLGLRHDMPRLQSAVDIASLSSAYGEALPLSIAESMACGVPCAVTDIGDAATLVGDTGRVVPPLDPKALSHAWQELLVLPLVERQALGDRARIKISLEYNINQVSERYLALYHSILRNGGPNE